jgi:methionine biosynthesis protein MetW|tara:strand:+ start:217 stop:810 length:594 start_codon:yes stop_codon:yes gene_type:complete
MKREFKIISDLLPNNSKVLDVGCGDGTLMKFLSKEKNIDVRGLELNEADVEICISKGLSVIEGNAENELGQFPNKSFDYVILSQTLQAFYNPVRVLDHLLRIGKASIISVPNFGHWKVRASLLFFGRMPITKSLPYKWYDTPNLHMCTIKDFYELCQTRNINMKKIVGINNDKTSLIHNNNIRLKNLFSEVGIFLIS